MLRFDQELKDKEYLFGAQPTIADFFLYEALDVYCAGLGWEQVKQRFPALVRHFERPRGGTKYLFKP